MFSRFPRRGGYVTPPPTAIWPSFSSLAEFVSRHTAFQAYAVRVLDVGPKTVEWYRNGFSRFEKFISSTMTPEGEVVLNPQLLEEWVAWLRTTGIRHVTVRTYWRSLKRFIRALALQDGLTDPFQYVPTPGVPEHVYKALSPTECERVLATAANYPWPTVFERHRNVAMLGTALYAGLRKKEVLQLQVLDVDLQEGTIAVRHGKGRYGGKPRTAYIPLELRELLQRYSHERKLHQLDCPEFFSSLKTGRGVSPQALKNAVRAVRTASGVHFSMHVLRHSFVTMLLRSGVPIHVAKELAGHANITTTEGYARVFSDDMRRHVESVAFHVRPAAPPPVHDRSIANF